jgi:hypothetical protein
MGLSLALAGSNCLHVLQLTWRKMESGIDRAVDDPGLEARVTAEGYGGCHGNRG